MLLCYMYNAQMNEGEHHSWILSINKKSFFPASDIRQDFFSKKKSGVMNNEK